MILIEDIKIGDTREFEFMYDASYHYNFMKLSGDDSKVHSDIVFCQRNGYSSLLGYSYALPTMLSNIFGKHFPGGSELCLANNFNFRTPYFIDDKIIFKLEVENFDKNIHTLSLKTLAYRNSTKSENLILSGNALLLLKLK